MVCAEEVCTGVLRIWPTVAAKENFTTGFAREQLQHARAAPATQRRLIMERTDRAWFGASFDFSTLRIGAGPDPLTLRKNR